MKNVLLILGVLFFSVDVYGQTWSEWFDQKSTQKKYLLQQIVALKIYAGYAAKGYGIVKNGLGIIERVNQGDFDLHSKYFSSLIRVNPSIRKYSKVLAILSMQVSMMQLAHTVISKFKNDQQFTPDEHHHIKAVMHNILKDINAVQDQLVQVIYPNALQMKDDERIKIIDQLYTNTQEQQTVLSAFAQEAIVLAAQRSKEAKDLSEIKKLNALP